MKHQVAILALDHNRDLKFPGKEFMHLSKNHIMTFFSSIIVPKGSPLKVNEIAMLNADNLLKV